MHPQHLSCTVVVTPLLTFVFMKTSTATFKSLPALFFLVLCLSSCPLWGQDEIKSVGDRPWTLTTQLATLRDIGSSGSIAVERRRKVSTSKFRQSGIRIGVQGVSLYFFDEVKGFGVCGGAYWLAGQTHCLDLHAGGALINDTSSRTFNGFGRGVSNSGYTGLTLYPLLSVGYRYVNPGPTGIILKAGIGTLGPYAGFGLVLK